MRRPVVQIPCESELTMRFGIYQLGPKSNIPQNEKAEPVKVVRVFGISRDSTRLHLDIDEHGSGVEIDMTQEELANLRDLLTAQLEGKPYPVEPAIKFIRGLD